MSGVVFIRDLAVLLLVAGGAAWLCRRAGLSVVVGYLLAGIVVGPHTPPFQLVTDLAQVEMLAEFGLIFLVFSIGLGLGLGRLQRLGLSMVVATVIGALMIFNLTRVFGAVMGLTAMQTNFVAAMLMVSSSAIISKVLEELKATHAKAGQLALGVTVLEDGVAVVMLTLLISVTTIGGSDGFQVSAIGPVLGKLSAFVAFLTVISLLLIPRLLRRLGSEESVEIRNIIVAGVVLGVAWLATQAGYSMALGAFVLGAVIAGTRHKAETEKVFDTLKHLFGSIFFVAIGMLFDFRQLAQAWPMILALVLFVLVCRPFAAALGLLAIGNASRDAYRAGMYLLPIGEFSFIIAQVGVKAEVLPDWFHAVAVGLSLATSLIAPMLTRQSGPLSEWLAAREPAVVKDWLMLYREWLVELQVRRNASVVWRLAAPRLGQVAVQALAVSALMLFSVPIYDLTQRWVGSSGFLAEFLPAIFWTTVGVLVLAPLIAVWRNAGALAMLLAEAATSGSPRPRRVRILMEMALRFVVVAVFVIWFLALLPFGDGGLFLRVIAIAVLVMGALVALFRRKLVRWHSKVEAELQDQIRKAQCPAAGAGLALTLLEQPHIWNLTVDEFTLPSQSDCVGKSIKQIGLRGRVGCSIVGIDRQGVHMPNPKAEEVLYPGDILLLIGTNEQLAQAEAILLQLNSGSGLAQTFGELTNDTVVVPDDFKLGGETLMRLDLIRRFGIQVCGIHREGRRILVPAGTEMILPGDHLLVLGTLGQIGELQHWFEAPEPAAPAS